MKKIERFYRLLKKVLKIEEIKVDAVKPIRLVACLKNQFFKFLKSAILLKNGATLIEIALYIALVVVVCIAVITALGGKLQHVFQTIVNSI